MSIRVALAGFVATFASQATLAADVPALPAPDQAVTIYDWTGIYLGANAGYGSTGVSETVTAAGANSNVSVSAGGGIAGGQIGANLQFGSYVLGGEVDAQWSDQHDSATTVFGRDITLEIPWLATARLRAGWSYDRIHYYVTGGAGYFQFKRTVASGTLSTSSSASLPAWVIGVGSESAITRNVILRFEALYLRPSARSETVSGLAFSDTMYDVIGRVGLSYKFGGSTN